MKHIYKQLAAKLGEKRILRDEPMAKYVSFKIGGVADFFFKAKTKNDLINAVTAARKLKLPFFILGGGTNILVGDRGFRGLIIKNETATIKLTGLIGSQNKNKNINYPKVDSVLIEVESGVSINHLVRFTLDQGFSGLEYFLGQPGTVGGAIWINAHNIKMRKFFSDNIYSIQVIKEDNNIDEVFKNNFQFGYDQSAIQKTQIVVLSAKIKLRVGDKNSLWKKAQQVLEYRRLTQPYGVYTAGCTFRNISKSEALRLATPNYTCSAGFLIESVGLKGKNIGSARFSHLHANFIVHNGEAKAIDVLELINLAKIKVKEKYGIELKEEIVMLGDF